MQSDCAIDASKTLRGFASMAGSGNIVVSKRLVAINSASSVLSKLLNMTVLLWAYRYLLRRISPEEFSVLPVVMAVMVVAPLFFSFMTGGISRHVVAAYARGDFATVTRIISSIVPFLAGAALVFLVIGVTFSLNIEHLLNVAPQMVGDARLMMALLVFSFVGQMLALPWVTGFHVRQRFVELNLLGVVRDLLRLLLLIVFLLSFGPKVVWVVMATVIAEGLHSIATYVRGRQMVPQIRFSPALFDLGQARGLVSFGIWTTVGQLGSVMHTNAATIVLNILGTPLDVTCYHIGATFFRQLESLIQFAALPLQPAMTALHATDEPARLANAVLRGGRYGLWVSMGVATPLFVYADTFIGLYVGPEFWQASVVIMMFMSTFFFTKPVLLLGMLAMAVGRVREFFLPALLFQFLGLMLMLVFVQFAVAKAVAVTLSLMIVIIVSEVTYFWNLCLRFTRVTFVTFARKVLLAGTIPALVSGIFAVSLKIVVQPDSWSLLISCVLAVSAVYAAVLLRFCLDTSERRDLDLAVGKLRSLLP